MSEFAPEVSGGKTYDPLPEDDYAFVIVPPITRVDVPDWKLEYVLQSWNENEQKRAEEQEGYAPHLLTSADELPVHKKHQYEFHLRVRDGKFKDRFLPRVFLPIRWTTDAKYRDRANWYKFLKVVVPNLKEMADKGELPTEEQIIGYGGICTVEMNSKGGNKITGYTKDKARFGVKDLEASLGVTEVTYSDDADAPEIPF